MLAQDADAVRQSINVRLSFFRGEWFLDETAGIPYYQQVFQKQPRGIAFVDAIFKDAVLSTKGVRSIKLWSSEFAERRYSVNFVVNTIFGDIKESWQA